MVGASVNIKGTERKTITNENGEFSFNQVDEKATLVISFIGYETHEIRVDTDLGIIKMSPSTEKLTEVQVVNTGYQSLPKERSTGSFLRLSNKALGEQVSTNIIERLEGITSSLSIDRKSNGGEGYGIIIRGISTIRGPRSPLIVLDNFPYEGDINSINPNDVESITILKDAAASSIWGVRAGNGVIVITTKKAKFNQKQRVVFSGSVKVAEKPDQNYLSKISPNDFIDLENKLFDQGYFTSFENSTARPPLSEVVELRIAARDGRISAEEASRRIEELRQYDLREQLDKYVYQNALNQQYALELGAGTDKRNWLLSMGADRNVSSLDASFNRYNIKAEKNIKITDKFTLTGNLLLSYSKSASGKVDPSTISTGSGILPPYTRLADENGNSLPVIRNIRQSYALTAGQGKLLDWSYYPLEDYKYSGSKIALNSALASFKSSYQFFDWLKLTGTYQFEQQDTKTRSLNAPESFFVRDLINFYSSIDANGVLKRAIPTGSILDQSITVQRAHNVRMQVDVEKVMGHHSISSIFGAEARSRGSNSELNRSYGIDESTLSTAALDYFNAVPIFRGGTSTIPEGDSFEGKLNRYISFFGNLGYTFDQKYTLSLSGRRDASNLYGLKTNDKWNPLFSAGLSWEVTKEDFFKVDALSFLKLRATFGTSGNTDPSNTAVTTLSYRGNSPYTQTPYAIISNYANPLLRWERVLMFNAGLDFASKNSRIAGSLEYYHKRSVDLLAEVPIDLTIGTSASQLQNAAIIQGEGFDVELNSKNIVGKFSWQSDFFINFYHDKVIKNYVSNYNLSAKLNGNVSYSNIEGYPLYSMISYKWAGLDPNTGDPQGLIKGAVSKNYSQLVGSMLKLEDMVYHGSALPRFTGGLGNSFSYLGFSLAFRLSYKFGYYFRKQSLDYGSVAIAREGHGEYSRRWQKPGDELVTNVPSMVYPISDQRDEFYWGSEVNVLKGDHLRLQYVNLGYSINLKNQKKTGLYNIYVFAVANNLGILWRANKYQIDPDFVGIPDSRNFAIGLKTTL